MVAYSTKTGCLVSSSIYGTVLYHRCTMNEDVGSIRKIQFFYIGLCMGMYVLYTSTQNRIQMEKTSEINLNGNGSGCGSGCESGSMNIKMLTN